MKEIYNEGRVIGLSAYELYVRQLLSVDPTSTPLTEREWLASTLSESCSMILKVPQGTQKGWHDYILPEGSDLCGCTVIYGSLFEGDIAITMDDHWAARVDDYGNLISNTIDLHPETPGESANVPVKPNPEVMSQEFIDRCKNYIKITSGMMFQPGEWVPNIYYTEVLTEYGDPVLTQAGEELLAPLAGAVAFNSIVPDFSKLGFIRLAIQENLTADVYIFLHGFAHKSIMMGSLSFSTQSYSDRPQDGDFLGPAVFPWGCPITLITTTNIQYILYKEMQSLRRP